MCVTLGEWQSVTNDDGSGFPRHFWLGKGRTLRLQDLTIGGYVVDDERFCIADAEVADERAVRYGC